MKIDNIILLLLVLYFFILILYSIKKSSKEQFIFWRRWRKWNDWKNRINDSLYDRWLSNRYMNNRWNRKNCYCNMMGCNCFH
jgi:hypothetical protein